jgi:spore coat polysaccharide biosynthesis protein SpsF (cytidylyltransferase family)
MKIVAIVQARMGSTRLPGKVMKEILGRPLLYHFLERLKRVKRIDEIIIATPKGIENEPIFNLARGMGVPVFKGSEEDVLDRFYQCAIAFTADVIVRITSDCPLIDPEIVDKTIETFLSGKYDYCSNNLERSLPHGLDTEVFSFKALEKAWLESTTRLQREHVSTYIKDNPQIFRQANYRQYKKNLSNLRWTVDYPEDLEFVRLIFGHFGNNTFSVEEILNLLYKNPELLKINESVPHRR